jgi:hypothetical protein
LDITQQIHLVYINDQTNQNNNYNEMATEATSKVPRETPSTPTKTKAKSAASSVKGSPKSAASKTQKQVGGKDTKTPRKLKRKVEDTITPAAERTSSPASTKDLPSRPATGKKSVPSKRLEQRAPEPEPEPEIEPEEQLEEEKQDGEGEEAGIQLEDNDTHGEQEEDEEEQEADEGEQDDLPEPSVSAPTEQRHELADNQSQASGSVTGGFFSRTGNGLNSFARGLRGVAGSLSQGNAKGAADGVKDTAQGTVGDIANSLPLDISALKGLEVGEGGKIFDKSGNALGEVVEGDPEDLVGQTVGDDGEIVDEDGDLIGRVEILDDVQNKVTETLDQVKDKLPSLEDLKGLPVSEGGEIKDKAGNVLGHIVEGDPEDLVGQTINESGEILDEDGDLIGRAEVISPEEALKTIQENGADLSDIEETAEDAVPDDLQNKIDEVKNNLPQLADLDGLPVTDGGEIKDKAGNVVGKVVEGDPEDLVGQTVNDAGEILDEDGDLIGRVEVLSPDEAAQKVMDTADDVKDQATEAAEGLIPQIQILQGKKINKKGKILDEEGDIIGQVAEGADVKDLAGKKPNEKGEVLDKEGNVLGKVEVVSGEAADEALKSLQEEAGEAGKAVEGLTDGAAEQAEDAADGVKDLAALDGLQVNDEGKVVDSDGNVLAKLESGNLEEIAGQTVNENGLVIDDDGNILGRVSLIGDAAQDGAGEAAEGAEEAAPELPALSTLEGLKVNKFGKIINADGVPVGELIEGDAKKLSKLGATLDDKGQFWDNRGNVVGKAQTIPLEDHDTEGAFAGLEGLIVVKDGWVEDDNGNRVGQLVEGDANKLTGRAVDEDGDILDKHGNVVGRAERYEPPEEEVPEPEKPDFSSVAGLKPNKSGNVIGPDGVPIARVVEGKIQDVAGRKIDNEGQIWNDAGKVVGRVELIPEDERETKPEGIFGGLEGLLVNKDGFVEDEEGNIVGKIVEGDAKKLRGRAVDEDGDILDKHGNVKGRAEPYEPPEEEPEEEDDLSSLEGKTVNKMGNVVDEHGTIFGRIVDGDAKKLAGKRVDGKGQIWSDNGKVIGRAELIPGNEQGKPEGAFFGFDDAKVGKDGVVVDASDKIIGRLIEGDAKKLVGRPVDEDGDVLDKSGNVIGKAERWEPEEKKRDVNPMSGRKVNKQGEVRDENGDLIGKVTDGNLQNLIGKTIDDNGYIVDNDGNKIGEATLIENIPEPEPEEPEEELSPEELEKQKQEEEDRKLAGRMCTIVQDTLGKIEPVCKQITDVSPGNPLPPFFTV